MTPPIFLLAACLRRDIPEISDWYALILEANEHLVAPALYRAVSNNSAVELPEDVESYLHLIYKMNSARNEQLRAQCLTAIAALNAGGLEPTLIKGAAVLLTASEGERGDRMLCDLDILLNAPDLEHGMQLLSHLGYRAARGDIGAHAHAKLLRPEDVGTVDLHHRPPGPMRIHRRGPIQAGVSVSIDGCSLQLPSGTDRIVHLIGHDMATIPECLDPPETNHYRNK